MHKKCHRLALRVLILLVSTLINFSVSVENAIANDAIKVPFKYAKGVKLFSEHCSICHGKALEGSTTGPPLLHPFYKESHHSDSAFYRAALKGVTAHHWEFGNMPPVKNMTIEKMDSIIPFIRWYQKEKGL